MKNFQANVTLNDLPKACWTRQATFKGLDLFNSKYWSIVWCPTLVGKMELETVDEYAISNTLFKYWWTLQDTLLFIPHWLHNLCVIERRLPFGIQTTYSWKNIPKCWYGYIGYKSSTVWRCAFIFQCSSVDYAFNFESPPGECIF